MGYSVPRVVATVELDVISPESKELEKERSKDEEIVNTALVQLLVCITLCSGIGTIKGREGLKWLPKREVFRLGPAGKPVCEARTDGVLRKMGNPKCTLAILEVKPYTRRSNLQRIECRRRVRWLHGFRPVSARRRQRSAGRGFCAPVTIAGTCRV
jgi:hypothetical protein